MYSFLQRHLKNEELLLQTKLSIVASILEY
jgi:hypothetical protein